MGNFSHGMTSSSYYAAARGQRVFSAYATVTAPVIYSTAAGTGGPLLWNNTGVTAGSSGALAVLLALGVAVTTASGVAGAVGITGGTGQSSAPTTTTAIDGGPANLFIGGPSPGCNVYRKGTVANAGTWFQPVIAVGTGAVTVDNTDMAWADLHGAIIVPPGAWVSVAASATLTSAVLSIGLIWAELPL